MIETVGMEPMTNTVPTAYTSTKATSLQRATIRTLLLSQKLGSYCTMNRVVGGGGSTDDAAVKHRPW